MRNNNNAYVYCKEIENKKNEFIHIKRFQDKNILLNWFLFFYIDYGKKKVTHYSINVSSFKKLVASCTSFFLWFFCFVFVCFYLIKYHTWDSTWEI
jgi:hypothetical protein